jgi:hypothetical protein
VGDKVPDFGRGDRAVDAIGGGRAAGLGGEHDRLHGERGGAAGLGTGAELPGVGGAGGEGGEQLEQRRARPANLGRVAEQQPRRELGEQRAVRAGVGPGELEQQLDGGAQRVDGRGLSVGGGRDLPGGAPQRVLEQGQQELVLAVEVLVEAAQ